MPLSVKLRASSSVIEIGKSLALDCLISGSPIAKVLFKHNQNVIKTINALATSNDRRVFTHKIKSQTNNNNNNYFVVDSSASDTNQNQNSLLQPTNLIQSQSQLSRDELDSSRELFNDANFQRHIVVIDLEPQHAGFYQCVAINDRHESALATTFVRVLDEPPKFKDTFKEMSFELRQDISLLCSARANPLPQITWTVDDLPIPESVRTRFGDFVTKVSKYV